MSSSSTVQQLNFITQELNIYVALLIFATGVIGGLLNIIIFSSLKTFRQTSTGFYLIVTSIFNVGQALSALSTRILETGFTVSITHLSWSCKLRTVLSQSCVLISLTNMSLATIDQFLSMSSRRHWSSLKLARRHSMLSCCVWAFHGIFAVIYWDVINGVCTTANGSVYRRYLSYFYTPVLLGCLPIVVMVTFSVLAFVKSRRLARRQVNIVRLSHERQLTAMALFQVAFIVFASVPFGVYTIYDLITIVTNAEVAAQRRLIGTIAALLYYEQFASPFYIFCCVSKRFRKQLIYVLFKIHVNWMQKVWNRVNHNRIAPNLEMTSVDDIGGTRIVSKDSCVAL
ncbi:unnamed protein product [Adineta ricciae]|uniref:G-protein coupled receptors family 1 profile domain-containing protein n=2 Tax=Adineta ricciae TaxID=249248 RepID=A0A813R3H6_ADIRI|nr:unnamed protein product [Adineta ricciae]